MQWEWQCAVGVRGTVEVAACNGSGSMQWEWQCAVCSGSLRSAVCILAGVGRLDDRGAGWGEVRLLGPDLWSFGLIVQYSLVGNWALADILTNGITGLCAVCAQLVSLNLIGPSGLDCPILRCCKHPHNTQHYATTCQKTIG